MKKNSKMRTLPVRTKNKERSVQCGDFLEAHMTTEAISKATFEETYITSIFNEFTDQKGLLTT